jgi:hypothetical protein
MGRTSRSKRSAVVCHRCDQIHCLIDEVNPAVVGYDSEQFRFGVDPLPKDFGRMGNGKV